MEKSVPVQVRISLENLATITKFVRSNGDTSNTAGKIVSVGVRIFAEMLQWNKLSDKFDFNQAVDLLEREGLFSSVRVNKRVFTEQIGRTKVRGLPPGTSQQELQEIIKKFEEIRNGSECQVNDLTVPPQDDQLLAQLEEGIQTGKVPVAE